MTRLTKDVTVNVHDQQDRKTETPTEQDTRPPSRTRTRIKRRNPHQCSPMRVSKINPATSYSPTWLAMQYHRL